MYATPLSPGGGLASEYLPVRSPNPRGEYAIMRMPSSSHVSFVPLNSGKRLRRWYCTCSVAIGTPRLDMYACTRRSCSGP